MNKPTVADATRYAWLFGYTYWGSFKADLNDDAITPAIIANRNRFAVDYDLRGAEDVFSRYPSTQPGCDFDHAETYRDRSGGLVLVVSNYGGPPPPTLGLVRIEPIYSTATVSYAGRFARVRELKARLAACGGDRRPFGVRLDDGKASTTAEAAGASRGNLAPVCGSGADD